MKGKEAMSLREGIGRCMKVVGGRKGKGEYNVMIKFLKRIEKCVCPCVLCIFIETRGSSISYSYVLPYFESFIFVLHA